MLSPAAGVTQCSLSVTCASLGQNLVGSTCLFLSSLPGKFVVTIPYNNI